MAERLTPVTLDLEVRGSSLARRVLSLDKELTLLCLSSPRCIDGFDGLESRPGGSSILLGMVHATETGISSGRVGPWLMCAFTFTTFPKYQLSEQRLLL